MSDKKYVVIINGGDPINDCPTSYAKADEWAEDVNGEREKYSDPMWRWDCGFKLDFDGPLVRVSSRFYPPKSHYGPTWDGSVTIMIGDFDIIDKKFDCKTLEELRVEVEKYVGEIKSKLQDFLTTLK